jgi:hypothetical protein
LIDAWETDRITYREFKAEIYKRATEDEFDTFDRLLPDIWMEYRDTWR